MFSTALIVFREVLEAALVVSLVMAATKAVPRRGAWVACGLVAGILGAGLVAIFADLISAWGAGMGQELFDATVMFVAVAMLAWHSIWMSRHGREMAQHLNAVSREVSTGARPLTGLAIVVAVAVLREGSETVLFLYGIAAGEPGQAVPMAVGGALGIAGGVAVGAAMYFGLLQIPTHRLFGVTNTLIILLAAGMASQGTGYLVSADVLPAWGDVVWDTSWLLSESSVVGKTLHALIGYTAQPSGIQVVVYLATVAIIVGMARQFRRPSGQAPAGKRAA